MWNELNSWAKRINLWTELINDEINWWTKYSDEIIMIVDDRDQI